MIFTHKGWFGLCPVYLRRVDTECPDIMTRYRGTEWLFDLSLWIFTVCFNFIGLLRHDYEPSWPIRITGEGEWERWVGEDYA